MVHLTRRRFIPEAGAVAAAAVLFSGYATAYETASALTAASPAGGRHGQARRRSDGGLTRESVRSQTDRLQVNDLVHSRGCEGRRKRSAPEQGLLPCVA